MLTQPFQNIPRGGDFGNFPKSLQKERTANPSGILSRIHPSKLQTEPRGGKHVFRVCSCKIQSLVLETQHLRIIFGILDAPGMPGARNPTFTNYFWDFGPTWDVWRWKPNIYELFLRFWTYTWDAWCWKPIFRENVSKTYIFFTVWEPPGIQKRMKRMKAKWYTAGSSDPRFLTRLRPG